MATVVIMEMRRVEKKCVCLWSEVDIVVYHEDWVYGGMGAWEQERALHSEVVL